MPTDPAKILDLLVAFRRSKTMFAAVELGVFDQLNEAPAAADALATKLGCHGGAMQRLLEACVGLGLLSRVDNLFHNTPAATDYLCQSSDQRLTGYLRFSNDVGWKLWTNLAGAVREGSDRWKETYGWDGPIFSHFFRTEESKREFLMGMHGFGLISSPHVVRAFDLSQFRILCDLGGATGHLAIAACEAYASLQSIVFDLNEVVPLSKEIVAASSVHDRVLVTGGDFFNDPLPQADLYTLGRIVHDWNEVKIAKLLERIYAALPDGGGLLLAEKMIDDNRGGPDWAQMQDLNMLCCTEGRERTLSEYSKLLHQAGFKQVAGRATASPLDAILAIK